MPNTHYTEEAIKRSIEGGYRCHDKLCARNETTTRYSNEVEHIQASIYQTLFDPNFWRCLGITDGWKIYTWTSWKGWDEHWIEYPTDNEAYNPPSENAYCQRHITSVMYQHRLIDHLAQDKSIESFFEELLSGNK